MDEAEVTDCIKGYFCMEGYNLEPITGYSDIVVTKGNEKWVVEVKGDRGWNRGNQLIAVIGQTIRNMDKLDHNTYFAIGISKKHIAYFDSWGVEGLKLLPIHLLLVDNNGVVEHKTPTEFMEILRRRKGGNTLRIVCQGLRFT